MKKIRLSLGRILVLFLALTVFSCQKDPIAEPIKASVDEVKSPFDTENMTELGEKLQDPYTLENMQRALESLQRSKKHGEVAKGKKIKPTHLYIKFKPKNEEQADLLKQDTTITYYDYPLDRKIKKKGDYYHDPSVPRDRPTPKYASVPVGHQLPTKVKYKVLKKLHIPDEEGDSTADKGSDETSKAFVYDLVDASLRLTGNLEEEENGSSLMAKSKWRPSGTIRVYEHGLSAYIGVSGVQVRARRWYTTHKGFTSSTGRFSCDGRFRRDANYSIKWDRYEYSIRSGTIGQAVLNGPKRRGSWNVDLGSSSRSTVTDKQQYYALIHQGALDYYYGGRFWTDLTSQKQYAQEAVKNSRAYRKRSVFLC